MGGECLGFAVGPGYSLDERWAKSIGKYATRCREFARAKVAPSVGFRYHEGFAAATLSYTAQLTPDAGGIAAA